MLETAQTCGDDQLRSLGLNRLVDFLERRGWTMHSKYGKGAFVYRHPAGYETLVPRHDETDDFPRAVNEILRVIALSQGVEPSFVYSDVLNDDRDIFRIQALIDSDESVIGLDALPNLVGGGRRLLRHVASTVLKDESARNRYLRESHWGQTEPGSYVVSLLSPPIGLEAQLNLLDGDKSIPDARRVTRSLQQAIANTRVAVSNLREGDDAAFDDASDHGISYVACESIAQSVRSFPAVKFQVTEAWLPNAPASPPIATSFTKDDLQPLKEAAEALSQASESKQRTLRGYLSLFERDKEADVGRASMRLLLDGSEVAQTVNMSLDEEQWKLARDLELNKSDVEAKGMLEQTGKRTWWLRDVNIRKLPEVPWDDA